MHARYVMPPQFYLTHKLDLARAVLAAETLHVYPMAFTGFGFFDLPDTCNYYSIIVIIIISIIVVVIIVILLLLLLLLLK